ncbi:MULTISPECIES: acetyl/propionyl/methylcrotonyl-CoA carboxylase subunit alpha [unclassified Polaromonas]|uniref:acetyl/propionyl/methylcrotonyl-CoA carboxylase subunit alpha n=1 Tax=unclassified Polaromonas TaxID=2638319 RepID=UPI000BBC4DCA|nr:MULTISPECIES: biotin carboxylase N-terminal domain-containing protein [unclassified Polaromonas]MDI1274797.1 biotin carboxylase N-terminal domain-containing protein [Polaromonas sp.]
MIKKVLIANRGEIACRIARTCRKLGLEVATVHSSADRLARHVREIGESVELGGAAPSESYLNIEAIIAAARRVGADAVHPGYGFVSENADFVRALEAAGLTFIGPRAETIERVGGKASAKREAARLGVPVIPGSESGMTDPAEVLNLVRGMTLPVLLKAVAGGGGRGMAVIDTLDGLEGRIESAMREAEKSFGNGELIVERYLPQVRHLEVQVAGDGQGHAIHLFERECTLQRRHQKVIEEAPSSGLSPQLRAALLADAVKLAAGVNYRGLGTVEFVVTGEEHYFLEVNPRLQVEHPVTEEVTGLDLVELQLRIADTGRLPLAQADVKCTGHAFEARLCAEDAAAGFLPATGRLQVVDFSRAGVRIESGVDSGDEISPHYDSMIAKLIAHASDRDSARRALVAGLRESTVIGLVTNLEFLQELLEWPETRDATFHTRLIDERHAQRGVLAPAAPPLEHLAAAALHWLAQRRAESPALGCWTLWDNFTGWRLSSGPIQAAPQPTLVLKVGATEWPVRFSARDVHGACTLVIGEQEVNTSLQPLAAGRSLLHCDGRALELTIRGDARQVELASALGSSVLTAQPYLGGAAGDAAASGQLGAPMMGKVVAVKAAVGETVSVGQTVIVLESMKMELHVTAPFEGSVSSLRCRVGDMVERHQVLAEVTAA